jgi:hypothetical protein
VEGGCGDDDGSDPELDIFFMLFLRNPHPKAKITQQDNLDIRNYAQNLTQSPRKSRLSHTQMT